MRNGFLILVCLGLAVGIGGCSCDPPPCAQAANRVEAVCGATGVMDAFGVDRGTFETTCTAAGVGSACLACVNAALGDAAGCGMLADCRDECTCAPGTICGLPDGGADGGRDAGDARIDPCDISRTGSTVGSACRTGTACTTPFTCNMQGTGTVPAFEANGTPFTPNIAVDFNPTGGLCSQTCDLDAADTCGSCATCSLGGNIGDIRFVDSFDAAGNALGLCRTDCTPNLADRSGCRAGYQCDLISATCIDGCTSDDWCKIADYDDVNGDGDPDFVIDPSRQATCDLNTGRCHTQGDDSASVSDPCTTVSDCPDDGFCAGGEFCTRLGCTFAGFECGTGEVCDVRNVSTTGGCLAGCSVGADSPALGTGSHGDTCAAGFSCSWDGAHLATDAQNGSCIPGDYNDIAADNVGSACLSNSDCYSPFGYARCIFNGTLEVNSGICSISNCLTFTDAGGAQQDGILPGVTTGGTPVCTGADEACVNFGGSAGLPGGTGEPPLTFCMQTCATANDCAPGFACPVILNNGGRLCWPNCEADTDCRTGSMCRDTDLGACDPANEVCYCTDRAPRDCFDDGDCVSPNPPECVAGDCVACDAADDAGCSPTNPQCLAGGTPAANMCVQCLDDSHCTIGGNNQCVGNMCVACDPADDAPCTGPTPQCNPATNMCVACVADADCLAAGGPPECVGNACVACDTTDDSGCGGATTQCVGAPPMCEACDPANDNGCLDVAFPECAGSPPTCGVCDAANHAGCAGTALNVCDMTTRTCRACIDGSDCVGHPDGTNCNTGTCGP